MEDRYLFKGKRFDNEEWVIGDLVQSSIRSWISSEQADKTRLRSVSKTQAIWRTIEVNPSTICQCTGLEDKNGKLIWENDIANCSTEGCYGYIGWNESEAGFYFNALLEDGRFEEEHIYDYQDCMEVIGNIFDNPELLEV